MPKFIRPNFSSISIRDDGPSGARRYWKGVKLHREDGPAIIFPDGRIYWFLDGSEYNFFDWWETTKKTNEQIFSIIEDIEEEITILKLQHFKRKQ